MARGDEIDRSDHIKNEACFNKNNMKHRSEHEKDNDIQCQSLMLNRIKLDIDPIAQYLDILKDVSIQVAIKRVHSKAWHCAREFCLNKLSLSAESAAEQAKTFAAHHVQRWKLAVGV